MNTFDITPHARAKLRIIRAFNVVIFYGIMLLLVGLGQSIINFITESSHSYIKFIGLVSIPFLSLLLFILASQFGKNLTITVIASILVLCSIAPLLEQVIIKFNQIGFISILIILFLVSIINRMLQGIRSTISYSEWIKSLPIMSDVSIKSKLPGLFAKENYGTIVFFLLLAIFFWVIGIGILYLKMGLILNAIGFGFIWFGGWSLLRARRHSMLGTRKLMDRDKRKVVFLLRSFSDDKIKMSGGWYYNFTNNFPGFEDIISHQLWQFGPVIAVGQPGEKLPPVGAAREYIKNEEWQTKVNSYAADSQLITFILGKSDGVLWELQHIVESGLLSKVIIIFPPLKEKHLHERWERNSEFFKNMDFHIYQSGKTVLAMIFENGLEPCVIVGLMQTRVYFEEALRYAGIKVCSQSQYE